MHHWILYRKCTEYLSSRSVTTFECFDGVKGILKGLLDHAGDLCILDPRRLFHTPASL